jgi:hypothetical protein
VSPYGRIITGADVETAAETTIKLWQADYLSEVASQSGLARGVLPQFRSYPRLLDISKWGEDQTPSCVISAPGTLQTPENRQRQVKARWALGIGCIVSAKDMPSTLRMAQLYTAAVRALILQHPSMGGLSDGVVFISERYDELDANDSRSIASGVVQFGVDVLGITDTSQGPSAPSSDATLPPGDWHTVTSVGVDVEKVN